MYFTVFSPLRLPERRSHPHKLVARPPYISTPLPEILTPAPPAVFPGTAAAALGWSVPRPARRRPGLARFAPAGGIVRPSWNVPAGSCPARPWPAALPSVASQLPVHRAWPPRLRDLAPPPAKGRPASAD